jgi:TolB protein
MNPDGSNFRRLTARDNDDHFYPSISPEGSSVLFSSNMHGDYEIYEMPLGGEPIRLTAYGDAYAPAVSPDGNLIAFTRSDGINPSIWVMNRDGSNPRQVATKAWDAAWSPDGTQLLHASDRSGEIQIHVVNLDGSNILPLLELDGLRGRNDWSPTGEWLATYAGESWNREIVLFDFASETQLQVTDGGNNLAPSFSLDGQWIAFTSYRDRYREDDGCEIYIMRVNGSDVRRLTDNEYCDWQPRWGP